MDYENTAINTGEYAGSCVLLEQVMGLLGTFMYVERSFGNWPLALEQIAIHVNQRPAATTSYPVLALIRHRWKGKFEEGVLP